MSLAFLNLSEAESRAKLARILELMESRHKQARTRKLKVFTLDERRAKWIAHWSREARRKARWDKWMTGPFFPQPCPEVCLGLMCGAKTRSGEPCRLVDISKQNGRCKFHAGKSTGPRTEEGKKRVTANLPPKSKKQTL